jgi:xylulokinase
MDNIVALDIGTTGVKAALVDRRGQIVESGYAGYPTFTDGNRVEQEPEAWWRATGEALAALWQEIPAGRSVAGVALSGQMQDTIPLGSQGAVGRAILYSDCRAEAEARLLDEQIGAARLAATSGNSQTATSVLAKWLWLARQDPAQLAATQTLLLGAHDYITWRLCGARTTDYTTAATTGLLDLRANCWDETTIRAMGLDPALLPELRRAGVQVGTVSASAAQMTGLPVGTPVFQGVGDLGATTVGVGAGVPGRLYGYLGTSGWLASTLAQAEPCPERGVFTVRHPDPSQVIQVVPMLTAGGNLEWLRGIFHSMYASVLGQETVAPGVDYELLNQLASSAPAGSRGLLYLPYLAGERSPFSAPDARACFVGLSAESQPSELARAVLEGTALAYRALREALGPESATDPAKVHAGPLLLVGGGAKSPVWTQILADVLDAPVHVSADPGNAAARGAALIAGQTLGWFAGYAPTPDFFPTAQIYMPNPAHRDLYDRLFALFASLHLRLESTFAGLAALRQGT